MEAATRTLQACSLCRAELMSIRTARKEQRAAAGLRGGLFSQQRLDRAGMGGGSAGAIGGLGGARGHGELGCVFGGLSAFQAPLR